MNRTFAETLKRHFTVHTTQQRLHSKAPQPSNVVLPTVELTLLQSCLQPEKLGVLIVSAPSKGNSCLYKVWVTQ